MPATTVAITQHLVRDEAFKGKGDIAQEEWTTMITALSLMATPSLSSEVIKTVTLTMKKIRWTWKPTWEESQREIQCQLEMVETIAFRTAREVHQGMKMMATETQKKSS